MSPAALGLLPGVLGPFGPLGPVAGAFFGVRKSWIGLPSLAVSPASGIWLWTLRAGSGGCGYTAPTASFFASMIVFASTSVLPTTSGTTTLPVPIAVTTCTTVCFSTFSPALGVWSTIVPGWTPATVWV